MQTTQWEPLPLASNVLRCMANAEHAFTWDNVRPEHADLSLSESRVGTGVLTSQAHTKTSLPSVGMVTFADLSRFDMIILR